MFQNLKLSEFTWRREPILYLALAIAILNLVYAYLTGDLAMTDGVESLVALLVGFFGRGQVSPR